MDYCDVCGVPMTRAALGPVRDNGVAGPVVMSAVPGEALGSGPPPGASSVAEREATPARRCPACGTPQADRFCEEDGYDFLLAPPVGPAPDTAGGAIAGPAPGVPDEGGPAPLGPGVVGSGVVGSGAGSEPPGHDAGSWQIVVGVDRDYFEIVRSLGGVDAAGLNFPRFVPERRFVLDRRQLLIGRRSRSRGVHPDIDLVGPPEDPGVSHLHALLVPQPDGWALVDLESANGTYFNDPTTTSIAPNTPVPLNNGDRVYLGAWTVLTIRVND